MSTEIKRKRISDFSIGVADNVELFARTAIGTNIRVRYDVKQTIGTDTGAVMSQAGVTSELKKLHTAIDSIKVNTIGAITSPDETIVVGSDSNGITIGVNASNIIAEKKGLGVTNNRIGVAIDTNEGNRLTLTPTGALRVESENFWKKI